MLDRIKNILNKAEGISDWIISKTVSESTELFLIKEKLDMNRACRVEEYSVRVFVDFEEEGKKFKGESKILIGASESDEEIEDKVASAVFAAGFVKNPWYDLPAKEDGSYLELKSFDNRKDLKEGFDELHKVIYKDYNYQARVNSCELFAVDGRVRIVSSKGVDVEYPKNEFLFELVTDSNIGQEPVEIFNDYYLKNIDLEKVEELVDKQLMETEGRSRAVKAERIENIRVILASDAVERVMDFYINQASDSFIYQKMSRAELGKSLQDEDARQKINIRMRPNLDSSIHARPVDAEGKRLEEYVLYEDGVVKDLVTSAKFSHYLGVENRGQATTYEVETGELALDEYRKGDYIELLTFSDFQMDSLTGDFGGEFRLARLVRDGRESYITGGAISDNLFKLQNTMVFSKEKEVRTDSVGPKALIFEGLTISGE